MTVRLVAVLLLPLGLVAPTAARDFACVKIFGPAAFSLAIAEDGTYAAAASPGAEPQFDDVGEVRPGANSSYLDIVSGPLLDVLGIRAVHIQSADLTLSGSAGLYDCRKTK